jgi:hypothetical protein
MQRVDIGNTCVLCHAVLQGALQQLDDKEAEEARQKEEKKREADAALKVGPDTSEGGRWC